MWLMSRYILSELLKVFLVTLMGMTMVLLLAGVTQEAVRQGLGLGPILRLMPYFLPNALVFAVPGTILFAACSVYGRMSAENEVLAAKSLGVSPLAFLGPGFALAFLVSLGAVWLNDIAASWGQRGVHRVVLQSVEQIVYGMLRTQRAYSTSQFSINVVDVQDRQLIRPTMTFHPSGGDPLTLTAEQARLELNPDKTALSIVLDDCLVDWGEDWTGNFPGAMSYEIPLTMAARKGGGSVSPSSCAMQEIPQRVEGQREHIQALQQQYAAASAYQMLAGDFQGLAGRSWKSHYLEMQDAQKQLFRLHLVRWRRWANGFSCLFFVMVGAPLAIRLRNADIWTSFGLCFLPILLLYYPLLMYGLDRAKCGVLPPYFVWLGNVVLFGVGLWLIRKVMRY